MDKNRHYRGNKSDNECLNDFLNSALSDLTANLCLLDTKISIIMATVGVVLGLVVACKSNILKAYQFYSEFCILNILFLLLTITYVLSIIFTFIYGINTVTIRFGKSKIKSFWFFKTELYGGISEKDYLRQVKKLTPQKINKNLACEVYKLNSINNKKMISGKKTVLFFSISCAIITILMLMVGIFYLTV